VLEGGVSHEGEIGGDITEILAEAGSEHGEEEFVAHHETEVLKLVGDGLEAQAVVIQGEIALESTKEFLLQEDDPLELVVGEEPIDLRPHRTSVITVLNDGLEDVQRDVRKSQRMMVASIAIQSLLRCMERRSTVSSMWLWRLYSRKRR
jgi:hypothetical protein